MGGNSNDGCSELMPCGEEQQKCATCRCHWNSQWKELPGCVDHPMLHPHHPLIVLYNARGTRRWSQPIAGMEDKMLAFVEKEAAEKRKKTRGARQRRKRMTITQMIMTMMKVMKKSKMGTEKMTRGVFQCCCCHHQLHLLRDRGHGLSSRWQKRNSSAVS